MTRNFVRRSLGKLASNKTSSERADALASLHQSLADFQEAVDRARAVGYTTYDQKFLDSVLAQFASIEQEIPASRPADLEKLVQRAKSLGRLRAFVYPPSELEFLAKTALDEMTTWLVPAAVLDAMRTHLLSVFGKEGATRTEAERRAALCILLDYYDYWDRYVDDEFTPFMRIVGGWLLFFAVGFAALSLWCVVHQQVLAGVFCAGADGAVVSVLAKLPPLTIYGEWASYFVSIARRIGTGLVASLIGIGLACSGIVSLPVGTGVSLTQVIDACTSRLTGDASCTPSHMLTLMAIAMLLGFSERAITSFSERLFAAPKDLPTKRSVTTG